MSNDFNRRDRNYGRDRSSGGSSNSFNNNHHRQHNSSERGHRSNSKDRKERRRSRSRSRSRERSYKHSQPLSRMERDLNKVEQLKKMGIEWGGSNATATNNTVNLCDPNNQNVNVKGINALGSTSKLTLGGQQSSGTSPTATSPKSDGTAPVMDLSNFTAPILVSARYTEQMQKRKLLWSNKKVGSAATTTTTIPDTQAANPPPIPTTTNKWEMTKFSQDSDGKVASKFLRLMGMKDAPKPVETSDSSSAPDVIKKQNEMFSTMEHQYEVARQVTHTMRGMGLGFGSQQRQF